MEGIVHDVRKAAEQGDARAQFLYGKMLYRGRGVRSNPEEALRWCRLAAEQGFIRAQKELGYQYSSGRVLPQDDAEAIKWFRLAAEQGDAFAQCQYASLCMQDDSIPKEEPVRWYQKAAQAGNASAMYNLGRCYCMGHGIQKDWEQGVRLLRQAAEAGYTFSRHTLIDIYAHGIWGGEKDRHEAVRQEKLLGQELLRKAEAGDTWDQLHYASYCEQSGSEEQAVRWYRKAADGGNTEALACLGLRYCQGKGVENDLAKGLELFRGAAEQGGKIAKGWLSEIYEYGYFGVARDPAEAARWR